MRDRKGSSFSGKLPGVEEVDMYIDDFREKGLVLVINGFARSSKLELVETSDLSGNWDDFCCDVKSKVWDVLEVLWNG